MNCKVVFCLVALMVCSVNCQFFGQSFSSSSVSGPGGVVSQSVYTDSNGNRVVNGVNSPVQPGNVVAQTSAQVKPSPALSVPRPVAPKPAASKPVPSGASGAGAYKPDNSGAYKPDNSGAYKPSG